MRNVELTAFTLLDFCGGKLNKKQIAKFWSARKKAYSEQERRLVEQKAEELITFP